MTVERTPVTAETLVATIQRDLTAADLGLTEAIFQRLSRNIAQALALAVEGHLIDCHRPEPDFGELERRA